MSAVFKKANTAVITGGASGIGLALAKKCLGYGMKVLVTDWNVESLKLAKSSLGDEGLITVQMDVSKVEDWAKVKDMVVKEFGGQINLLALNAGVSKPTSLVKDADPAAFQSILATNFFGVVNGLSALLPLILDTATPANQSAVVITGSKQGITNPPGNPAYNASKAAVKTVAEHLSHDLRDRSDAVGVHLLVPGWTWTSLAGAASGGDKPAAAWWPGQVVDFLEAKMQERQFWVLCPDNDVTEDMDRKRGLWNAYDMVLGRAPLSRWRDGFKGAFEAWMGKDLDLDLVEKK
ncbi:NAD(P)-binding protein [Xylariomycetidae sp. FL2044]|nr:NAD(P)-binding protein [Xylariomycetidae sp. FL2044]